MTVLYVLSAVNFLLCLSMTRFSPFGFELYSTYPAIPFVTLFVLVLAITNVKLSVTKKIKDSQLKLFLGSCLSYILLVILALSIVIMSSPLHEKASYQDKTDTVFMFWGGGPWHSGALVAEYKFLGFYKIIHYWDEDDHEFEYYDSKARELGLYPG